MISGRSGGGVCGGRRCADGCGGSYPASRDIVSTAGLLCLLAWFSSSPDEVERRSFPLASRVAVPGRACLIFPGAGDCGSHCLPVFISSVPAWRLVRFHRRRASAVDTFRVPVISSSSSHHLVRLACSFLIFPVCRLVLHRCSLFSSGAAIVRRTAGVSHPSPVSFSYELGKTAQNVISRSSSSDAPGFSFFVSPLPSRGASRALSVIMVVARGDERVLRFRPCRLVVGRDVIHLSCGVA